MKRGEVRWYSFKIPDKKRPVLILTRDSIIPYLSEITIVPLTTTIRDIPTEVVLTPADGLPSICAINCDHLQTVPKIKIGKLITTLSAFHLLQVAKAITFALNL